MQTNVLLGRIACTCTPQHSLYADDAALLLPSATDAITSLKSFSDSASHLGLNISWPKTKLQNICSCPINHQIFQWTVILSNQSTALFTLAVYNHRMVSVVQT